MAVDPRGRADRQGPDRGGPRRLNGSVLKVVRKGGSGEGLLAALRGLTASYVEHEDDPPEEEDGDDVKEEQGATR